MTLEFQPASIPLFVASIISAVLAVYGLRRRHVPDALTFVYITLGTTIWTLGYALRIAAPEMAGKMVWQTVLYIGNATTPIFFLIFALGRAHHQRWLSWPAQALYFLPAIITMVAVVTNDTHHLMWKELWIDVDLRNTPGPIYWFNIGYSYLFTIASITVLVQAFHKSPPIFRNQAATLIAAALIPVVVSLVTDIIGWDVAPNFDEPTFSLLFTNILIAWAIFGFKVLDIVPIAHSLVVQNMQDGILIVDMQDRVVYLNPAMENMIGCQANYALGIPVATVLQRWAEPVMEVWAGLDRKSEVMVPDENGLQHYELRAIQLRDPKQRQLGQLVIFHDITEQKQLHLQLQALATTDSLTHCYNRRYFLEQTNLELERARRFKRPLSILMIDIDHFKQVNDTYGHPTGDRVLQEFVLVCQQNIRIIDLLGRYGGEEFIILLPETDENAASQVAERIRRVVAESNIKTSQGKISISISIGVVTRQGTETTSLARLLEQVDDALYDSKDAGRNCVTVWGNRS